VSARIPTNAFEYYVALGPGRSYRAVADRFGITKRAVAKHATKEGWPARLVRIEEDARKKSDARAADALEEMNDRHLKIAKALQARALESLTRMPLEASRDVIRALELGVRQERLIRGEPTEREASIEEITRREIATLLVRDDRDDEAAAG